MISLTERGALKNKDYFDVPPISFGGHTHSDRNEQS